MSARNQRPQRFPVFVALLLLPSLQLMPAATLAAPLAYSEQRQPCSDHDPLRRPLFGDLHVHTRYSLDASTQGTRTTPAQAYRFARGAAIGIQPWDDSGRAARSLQLRRPLDFAMVSDHAELIGEVRMCATPGVEGYNSWQCMLYRHIPRGAYYLFNYMASMRQTHLGMCGEAGLRCRMQALVPWAEMQAAAERFYDRSSDCEFSTFVGYEWTGMQAASGGNLHRNVVFRNAQVPDLPAGFIDSPSATLLWGSLERHCLAAEGACDALVIPHNANLSAGYMFSGELDDGPMSAGYAAQRRRFEPLLEIMQHKGASECYFAAGPGADELCAFEQLPEDNIAGYDSPPQPDTGFLRQVLGEGLALERKLGVNPYQLGVIASTDTHLGTPGAVEEDRFPGHGGAGVPAGGEIPPGLPDKLEYNPGGLAVVWAEENSRDSIFAALRRREAYATSGPRINSRFFGGWHYPDDLCAAPDRIARAYAGGVPMGGVLGADAGTAPGFLVAASQDPGTADAPGMPLQRLQVIKGWVDDSGQSRQRVFDVAGDGDNGASVDLATCEPSGEGAAQLCAVWRDPDFNPQHRAYYYARVVENPSCRWSQRQCIAAGVDCNDPGTITEGYAGCCAAEHRPLIQERAWSSPIWYRPAPGSSQSD
ncbi:DUF3604 domain-containing protein [Seongchinamella sediminis]|nr:DUF3604 domain-containing protein [Seongchinamella sediminis]